MCALRPGRTEPSRTGNSEDLEPGILHEDFRVRLQVVEDVVQNAVGVPRIVGDACNAQGGKVMRVQVIDFGDGDVEASPGSIHNGLDNVALFFEGSRFAHPQGNSECAYVHFRTPGMGATAEQRMPLWLYPPRFEALQNVPLVDVIEVTYHDAAFEPLCHFTDVIL